MVPKGALGRRVSTQFYYRSDMVGEGEGPKNHAVVDFTPTSSSMIRWDLIMCFIGSVTVRLSDFHELHSQVYYLQAVPRSLI